MLSNIFPSILIIFYSPLSTISLKNTNFVVFHKLHKSNVTYFGSYIIRDMGSIKLYHLHIMQQIILSTSVITVKYNCVLKYKSRKGFRSQT